MTLKRDYYQVLGVEPAAGDDAIKKAYRRLAVAYHPDRNTGDEQAEERFKELNEAYQVLSDPAKRRQYDRFGHADLANVWRAAAHAAAGARRRKGEPLRVSAFQKQMKTLNGLLASAAAELRAYREGKAEMAEKIRRAEAVFDREQTPDRLYKQFFAATRANTPSLREEIGRASVTHKNEARRNLERLAELEATSRFSEMEKTLADESFLVRKLAADSVVLSPDILQLHLGKIATAEVFFRGLNQGIENNLKDLAGGHIGWTMEKIDPGATAALA